MTVVINGTTGISPVTAAGTSATIDGMTVGRGAGEVATNTAVGASALAANTTGLANTAVGYQAGAALTTPTEISLFGYQAGKALTTGYGEAFGASSLASTTTGIRNVAFGYQTLTSNTTGGSNTSIGFQSLAANTTASNNTAVGYQAGYANTTGTGLTAVGTLSLYSNTTGNYNTALGGEDSTTYSPLNSNTTGSSNTAIGNGALGKNTTASNNTAVGYQALYSTQTSGNNTALGYKALYNHASPSDASHVAIGHTAGYSLNTGADQYSTVFIGQSSGLNCVTGVDNTLIGGGAGTQITSSFNVMVGSGAGTRTTATTSGGYNTIIGAFAHAGASTDSGCIVIGNSASTTGIAGKGSNTAFISANGGSTYNGANTTTFATTSDERIKKNIVDVNGALNKILALRPVEFDYKENDKHEIGFIAQEYEQVLPEQIVTHIANEAEKEWVGEDEVKAIQQNLVPYLVAAIKELKAEIDTLKGQA